LQRLHARNDGLHEAVLSFRHALQFFVENSADFLQEIKKQAEKRMRDILQ